MLIPTVRPPARGVLPSSMGFKNAVFVNPGDDLIAKYNWLKSSERDGQMGALSATNRRTLILTPGVYELTATWTLDTNYVDITSMIPLNPATTIIQRSIDSEDIVTQTAQDIRISGFTIKNSKSGAAPASGTPLRITASDNSASIYNYMHFRKAGTTVTAQYPCVGTGDNNFYGTWYFCKSDKKGFRLGNTANSKTFAPTMWFCEGGDGSFAGDATNCSMGGTYYNCVGGAESFSGCATFGVPILNTAKFYNCISGDRSYGLGKECAGSFYNCIGGANCFGGFTASAYPGIFSGYARNCIAGGASFGSGKSTGKNSGELVNCAITAMPDAMYCEGAKIRDCYLQITGTDKNCIDLNDGNTKIYNSTLIANGTGNSITAGEAQNVLALHCRMNKDKHANVTNLVGGGALSDGYCIVDADVA